MGDIIMHSMGDGIVSPCGLHPMMVYRGLQAGFTTDWAEVDCAECLGKRPGVAAPTPLQKFYLTFGVKYRHENHPRWLGADPDGWVLIEAPDEPQARRLAHEVLGPYWSMLYPETHFPVELNKRQYYPDGQIGHIIGDYSTPDVSPIFTTEEES